MGGIIRYLSSLSPETEEMARRLVALFNSEGFGYFINETRRTLDVQRAYYAQGRKPLSEVNALRAVAGLKAIAESDNASVITKVDGIKDKSRHQSGDALDIYPTMPDKAVLWYPTTSTADLWKRMGELAKRCGFEWGGDWKPLDRYGLGWDPAHVERPS